MKTVTDIEDATHWRADKSNKKSGITQERIYRLFEMYDTTFDDTEYWICSDNGCATMAYITEKGQFLKDGKTTVPLLTEKEFFGLNIERKKALMFGGY